MFGVDVGTGVPTSTPNGTNKTSEVYKLETNKLETTR